MKFIDLNFAINL